MRISELARTAGLPVATVKYYLREGLLHAGRPTSATQADYDAGHVRRLRLVRALTDVGRLPLASVRAVLAGLDAGDDDGRVAAVATAHDALPPLVDPDGAADRAQALLDALGWGGTYGGNPLRQLDAALGALDSVGLPTDAAALGPYARAALDVAEHEVAHVTTVGSPAEQVEQVVVGTVLHEQVFVALRRLAQQRLFMAGPDRSAPQAPEPPA